VNVNIKILLVLLTSCYLIVAGLANAQTDKPNILVIMGDDIGWFNPSSYNHGMLATRRPISIE
jgi:hypothetical protein